MTDPLPKAAWGDYLELTKPRLSMLSVITALVGYAAARPPFLLGELLAVSIGTCLAAGGVAALNQWMEHDTDALMQRTASRPIPSGKVATGSAFVLGTLMCSVALGLIFYKVNGLAAFFTLATIVSYLGWYTPAKRWSRWSTEIGAVAGAFPPLIGWAAGEGRVTALGWILFGILFFWQMPHFLAIAWTHRRDYAAVHFPILSVRDEAGAYVAGWSFTNTLLLIIVSVLPTFLGLASRWYLLVAILAGGWFLWRALVFMRPKQRDGAARKLFFASIFYLPLVLGALVADRVVFF
ncbi:MAG: heme o synthase [Opitutaceae bacterium]|nr:heme o synthase [Opitutaceae bacterium]MBP9912323.1 heme o synthase [Opitutaceae bacterium]